MRFPRLSLPVLTKAEKTAVIVLTLVFSSGAALRAWEHSGVQLGPVKDWDTLRKLVVQARQTAGPDTVYPCFDPPPSYAEEHWPHRTQDSTEESPASSPHSHSSSKKNTPRRARQSQPRRRGRFAKNSGDWPFHGPCHRVSSR